MGRVIPFHMVAAHYYYYRSVICARIYMRWVLDEFIHITQFYTVCTLYYTDRLIDLIHFEMENDCKYRYIFERLKVE